MNPTIFLIILAIVAAAGVVGFIWFGPSDMVAGSGAVICGLVCGGLVLFVTIRGIVYAYEKRECHSFLAGTERDGRFIETGYMSWDCYVLTDNGLLPRGQLRDVDEGLD